jgi:predicted ATPase
MITRLHVTGFRCVKDASLALTPLHALVGPNDSGKSTLLRAVFDAVTPWAPPGVRFAVEGILGAEDSYRVETGGVRRMADGGWVDPAWVQKNHPRPHFLRLDPDQMRLPSSLVEGTTVRIDERGERLAGIYDWLLNQERETFFAIEEETRRLFPLVKRLGLKVVGNSKVLEVQLHDGTRVPAEHLSEGLLYWLAYASLPATSGKSLLLVEEPENGLHPTRIAEVVGVLRRVAESGTQVVLATHSPLVLNELRPEEVSVVTRSPEAGTQVRRFLDVPGLDRLLQAFSLGELWLAYADGRDEAALFSARLAS